MVSKNKVLRQAIILFGIAFSIRLAFYLLGCKLLPHTLQKFITADTLFYYDPLALEMARGGNIPLSLLTITRYTFLGYLSIFYRFFGYYHLPVSIFHCMLGALSIFFVFLSARLFLNAKEAFIIGLVASFHLVLVYWTPFVITETFFLLMLSLSIYTFCLFLKTNRFIYILPLIILLVFISLSRPAGFLFSILLSIYLGWLIFKKLFTKSAIKYFCLFNIVIIFFLFFLMPLLTNVLGHILKSEYAQVVTRFSLYIDELPNAKHNNGHLIVVWARLDIPKGINILKAGRIPDTIAPSDIAEYFKKYYSKFLMLAVSKLYTLFNLWVLEYSLMHNIFNVSFYGFIYLFSLIGLVHLYKIARGLFILILFTILSQVLLISLTYVDYDFRFRLPLEFILNIPVGLAIAKVLNINQRLNFKSMTRSKKMIK